MKRTELAIANTAEAFLGLINRYSKSRQNSLLREEHVLGDRAILWGGTSKIVISSLPITHIDYSREALGYKELRNFCPRSPSESLCADLLDDPLLLNSIINELATYDTIDLISYVASDELMQVIEALRAAGVRLNLPETPGSKDGRDVAKCFDTKSGFRELFREWNAVEHGLVMPPGAICHTTGDAARETLQRLKKGRRCLCKADKGESGIGLLWFNQSPDVMIDQVELMIRENPAFGSDPIVVEEIIAPPEDLPPMTHSPSIEAYIDPSGDVQVTYSCVQLFEDGGHFSGVLIDRESIPASITSQMVQAARFLGRKLAGHGYRGYFDLDFVVGKDYRAYVVEGNPRRTGGTHAHDLAVFLFGHSYHNDRVVLTRSAYVVPDLTRWDDIVSVARDLLFLRGKRNTGVIPVVTSTLAEGTLGYAVIERDLRLALEEEQRFLDVISLQNRSPG